MSKFVQIDLEILNVDTIIRVVPCLNDEVYGILVERFINDHDLDNLTIEFNNENQRDSHLILIRKVLTNL